MDGYQKKACIGLAMCLAAMSAAIFPQEATASPGDEPEPAPQRPHDIIMKATNGYLRCINVRMRPEFGQPDCWHNRVLN
jgi:hypothetical protein